MTIKTLLSKQQVADANFRSLPEIDKYLSTVVKKKITELDLLLKDFQKQFAKASKQAASKETAADFEILLTPGAKSKPGVRTNIEKIPRIQIPNKVALTKNFEVVRQYYDQYESLQHLYNTVSVNFKGVRGASDTLKSVKSMLTDVQARIKSALEFLQNTAVKHAPKAFTDMVKDVVKLLDQSLDFETATNTMYLTTTDEDHLQFTHYIQLHGLLDNDGAEFPQFFIVFTCTLKPSGNMVQPEYYVTLMHTFSPPGSFNPGKAIDSSVEARKAIFTLFQLENVSNSIGVTPHNLKMDDLTVDKFSVVKGIKRIDVAPDSITFVMNKSVPKSQYRDITMLLMQQLRALIQKKGKLKALVATTPEGNYGIRFTMVNLATDNQVSVHDLDLLKEMFRLDDVKLRQVVKILNSDVQDKDI